jgi:hypothetical protein
MSREEYLSRTILALGQQRADHTDNANNSANKPTSSNASKPEDNR